MNDIQRAIHCLKVIADEEVCEECDIYAICDHKKQENLARAAISALRELQQYRQIGTLENCYEANRRQSEMIIKDVKKSECPEDIKAYGAEALFGYCPNCGTLNNNIWNDKCCGNCGQALEWKGENDEQTDTEG